MSSGPDAAGTAWTVLHEQRDREPPPNGRVLRAERKYPLARFLALRLRRDPAIPDARLRAVQQRRLFAGFRAGLVTGPNRGTDEPKRDRHGTDLPTYYPREPVEEVIAQIRTDLDAFGEAEQKVLENHGSLMAEVAIRAMASNLPSRQAPPSVPYPDWMDPDRVRSALADSGTRRLLGRPYKRHSLDLIVD